jgi:hypothetical protein
MQLKNYQRLLILSLFTFPAWANLVQNPGFETGDLTSWTANSISNNPWAVTAGGPTIGGFSASTGCVGDSCINGTSAQQASLSQTITTVSGQNYVLGFFFKPNAGTPNELKVLFGNTVAFDLVNTAGTSALVAYSTTVAATSNSTTLTFLGRQDPGFDRLDDVSVNATGTSTPEPSTLLLVGGLLPLAAAFRRRML